jgi:hypothetical protein
MLHMELPVTKLMSTCACDRSVRQIYLRGLNSADSARSLFNYESRGFPNIHENIDCMQCKWNNFLVGRCRCSGRCPRHSFPFRRRWKLPFWLVHETRKSDATRADASWNLEDKQEHARYFFMFWIICIAIVIWPPGCKIILRSYVHKIMFCIHTYNYVHIDLPQKNRHKNALCE